METPTRWFWVAWIGHILKPPIPEAELNAMLKEVRQSAKPGILGAGQGAKREDLNFFRKNGVKQSETNSA
jgi:hypothetical protein